MDARPSWVERLLFPGVYASWLRSENTRLLIAARKAKPGELVQVYHPNLGVPKPYANPATRNGLACENPKKTSDGGSTDYYKIPDGAKDLQDLIEVKNMNFSVGNIFKAAYRLGEKAGNDLSYDLRKIIFFAQRELDRVNSDSSRNGGPE